MTRTFALLALLLLGACAGSSTRPDDATRPVEGPTVGVGGSMRGYYGNARQ